MLGIAAAGTPHYLWHQLLVRIEKGLEPDSVAFLHQAFADVDVQTLWFGVAAQVFQLPQQAAYGFRFLVPVVQRSRMGDDFKASADAGIGFHVEVGKLIHRIAGFSNGIRHFNFQLKAKVELVFGVVAFRLKEVIDRLVAVVMNPVIRIFIFAMVAIPVAHVVMVNQMPATVAVRVIAVPAGQADMVILVFHKVTVFIRVRSPQS